MSITFDMPAAPTEEYEAYPEEEPGFMMTRPVAPFTEINLSNGNAFDMLRKIDPARVPDCFGQWEVADLPRLHRTIMRLLNTNKREELYLDPFIDQSPGKCRMFSGGRDEEHVTRTLQRFLQLISTAQQHGFVISWG